VTVSMDAEIDLQVSFKFSNGLPAWSYFVRYVALRVDAVETSICGGGGDPCANTSPPQCHYFCVIVSL
jgi:hypothetical protein